MKQDATLYDILEVSPRASELVIKAAYRCLAQTHHPDKNSGDTGASARQAQINHAYMVLSDPVRRRHYDETSKLTGQMVDRRGSEAPAPRTSVIATDRQGLRAFAFRPLE